MCETIPSALAKAQFLLNHAHAAFESPSAYSNMWPATSNPSTRGQLVRGVNCLPRGASCTFSAQATFSRSSRAPGNPTALLQQDPRHMGRGLHSRGDHPVQLHQRHGGLCTALAPRIGTARGVTGTSPAPTPQECVPFDDRQHITVQAGAGTFTAVTWEVCAPGVASFWAAVARLGARDPPLAPLPPFPRQCLGSCPMDPLWSSLALQTTLRPLS